LVGLGDAVLRFADRLRRRRLGSLLKVGHVDAGLLEDAF
jgi:hypothetical protein